MVTARGDVGVDRLRPRLTNVRHVFEVVRSSIGPRGTSEIIERDRAHARGGKALGELLVERVEPADIRIDDNAGVAIIGSREVSAKARPIGTDEHRFLTASAAGDRAKKLRGQVRRSRPRRMAHRAYRAKR